ncbi:MAG TPA: 3-isopropylmalate dehydratase small subunit [Methanomassiliicoccales archaeon]|nr:3-isopropylmalate dehydratase small subunit [Methanomassiliicoccales archaeon]
MIKGRAWVFGDHINTDLIIPGRYLDDYTPKNLAAHVMEGVDPEFPKKVTRGDILVAGRNFGCGSSREQAPLALMHAGVAAIVADSFARIFFRNAINIGLPVIVCPGAAKRIAQGDMIEVDMHAGKILLPGGEQLGFSPLPAFLIRILDEGGLVPFTRRKLQGK